MTTIKKLLLAVATLFAAAAYGQSGPVYEYEVQYPGGEAPLRLSIPLGESKTATLRGSEIEFTNEETTLPTKSWKAMEAHGNLPAHDFVKCGADTCTFGTKTRVSNLYQLTVQPTTVKDTVKTRFRFTSHDFKLVGKPGEVEVPMSESRLKEGIAALAARDSVKITENSEVLAVLTLVRITE